MKPARQAAEALRKAIEQLGVAVHALGPLDESTRGTPLDSDKRLLHECISLIGQVAERAAECAQQEELERARADQIVVKLLYDMNGRRGFRQNWDAIDEENKEEILRAWTAIVEAGLKET